MKLIIDIDDTNYELINKTGITLDLNTAFNGKEKDKEMTFAIFDLVKALKNGTPYEPKGDLISREALKEKLKPCEAEVCEFACEGCHFRVVTAEEIDNAPTVEYTFDEAFQKTICEQKLYCPARPKGEWYEHIDKGVLKARHGDYVLYKVDYLLDNLAREVNIMESARRMKGEWIKIFENPFTNGYVCPFCGHKIQVTEQFLPNVTECESCGADMRGKEE